VCAVSCVKISLQVAAYGYLPWIKFLAGGEEMQASTLSRNSLTFARKGYKYL